MKQLAHFYLFVFGALLVGIAIGHLIPQPKPECPHLWGSWATAKTKGIYHRGGMSSNLLQRRTCFKCGWTEESYESSR